MTGMIFTSRQCTLNVKRYRYDMTRNIIFWFGILLEFIYIMMHAQGHIMQSDGIINTFTGKLKRIQWH